MSNIQHPTSNIQKSFTLIEVLIIIGIIIILISLALVGLESFQKKSKLDISAEEIINILRLAQSKTLASEEGSQYGIYFNNVVSPNQYIVFKGTSYLNREPAFDKIYELSESVEISQINLAGGKEVVFTRLEGGALPAGNLTLRLINNPLETKNIYIESSGLINLISSSVLGEGRLIDSRHAHFSLGWSIQNAANLKFFFPNIPQTEIIDMINYFNPSKTEFDWNGSFNVAGKEQTFRIHTHYLDSFDTLLCIHRERNQGKNDQEVIIYIVDGGLNKEIAHYLADSSATVNVGASGGIMEIQ